MALTAEQRRAYNKMKTGENIFLSGRAGTGKSYLLNHFIKANKNRNILICAPTGIAAINIGGTTIHRAFKAPIRPLIRGTYNAEPTEAVLAAEIIIIDEISMCRSDLFNYVADVIKNAESKRGAKKKQLIVVGDFFQLPPVVNRRDKEIFGEDFEGFAFQAETWADFDFTPIVLKKVLRQKDNDFIENLNKVRYGNIEGVNWINQHAGEGVNDGIYICGTNIRAQSINEKGLDNLNSPSRFYYADVEGDVDSNDKFADERIVLKNGARVMSLINDPGGNFQNGSMGIIRSCTDSYVRVEFNNGYTEDFQKYTWEIYSYKKEGNRLVKERVGKYSQIPLKLAYAITIHKSQGKTFDRVTLFPSCFLSGQLYVALSRVSSISGLSLDYKIKSKDLVVSDKVVEFYKSCETT